MAAIMSNTPGTGNNIPISNYVAGITESYPNVNRQRTVESSINSKETIDFLPTNIGINQSISDKYLEFRINGTVGSFLDLSSIIMELQLKPLNAVDGNNLKEEDLITFVNGLSNIIFKSVTVFLFYLYTLAVSPSWGGSRQQKRNNKNNGGFTPFFQQ